MRTVGLEFFKTDNIKSVVFSIDFRFISQLILTTLRLKPFSDGIYLRELQKAGARVLTYVPGMLHAKVILIDEKVVMFGSVNIDLRSLFVNYEVGLFCYSKPEVVKAAEWAETIIGRSIVFESDRKRPPGFVRTIAEDLSRLVAPLI